MLQIYDSVQKKKVKFESLEEGKVGFYLCGPTVYDKAHLGHGRSALAFDVIRKYLEYSGYDVTFVSNYTDIDDKMINRAHEEGISVADLAEKIIPEYEKDYEALGIKAPDILTRATDKKYIEGMIELIKRLKDGGFAYELDDGIYFEVSKYDEYGEFSGQKLEDLRAGARIEVDERKRNPYDFVLWKFKKAGEPAWESPWGEGRPGWHIECSVMSWKELGEKFDIHGGGLDLKFPHHECEVAQSKCAFGEDAFAKFWIHNGFIQVDDEKMSKSLGNFRYLQDILQKYSPQVVRLMFLQTHYRNPINFSEDLLEQAKAGLERLHDFVRKLKNTEGDGSGVRYEIKHDFERAMNNDFDTSGALAVVFDVIKIFYSDLQKGKKINTEYFFQELGNIDNVLGIVFPRDEVEIPGEVSKMVEERELARTKKDFQTADRLRDEIAKMGYTVEDAAEGGIVKRK